MLDWPKDSVLYHIYPLGLCGAPQQNDFRSPAVNRLDTIHSWLDHIQALGANALYLGPVFESSSHGYDTADYYHVDRRLGTNDDLQALSEEIHRRGMRLILDGIFHHVGRDFWAFHDLRRHGQDSPYKDWFQNLRFGESSPFGDPFAYEGWDGHLDLVKLNLGHPAVREHLFGAVRMWMDEFGIDGLRLDAADAIDLDFLQDLAAFSKGLRSDFWLMGEVVHGDYRRWANAETLDSVTNYEAYKGLYSSLNDRNYFEIAYALQRQFGPEGIYRDLSLYSFADNHDVKRVASSLKDPADLFPLHFLLFTMPGVPSIYYGSEFGLQGRKNAHDDWPLRPALDLDRLQRESPQPDLVPAIRRLARLRHESPALRQGSYRQVHVDHQQLAFLRQAPAQRLLVALNAAPQAEDLALDLRIEDFSHATDVLDPGEPIPIDSGRLMLKGIPPKWGRILELR